MAYIAKKVCSFAGRDFLIGNPIPDELINPGRVADLIKIGVITEVPDVYPVEGMDDIVAEVGQVKFEVNIHAEEGDLPLELTNEELQQLVDVLQAKAEEAKALVAEITSENVLIMVDCLHPIKSVRSAVKERAAELFPQ